LKGEVTQYLSNPFADKNKISWLQHPELFERNKEVHQIVDFLFNEGQKMLVTEASSRIGTD
jgi:hypothetical protein